MSKHTEISEQMYLIFGLAKTRSNFGATLINPVLIVMKLNLPPNKSL